MKRMLCIALSLALVLLCGCESAELQGQTEESTQNVTEANVDMTDPVGEQETKDDGKITIGQTGRVRVDYNGMVSSVRYVTSADQLPDNEALAAYDDAYFETGALLIVMETVGSGSYILDIVSAENGVVELSRELPGDVGTADMATWLLWAEVEQGLDYDWSLANSFYEPETNTH